MLPPPPGARRIPRTHGLPPSADLQGLSCKELTSWGGKDCTLNLFAGPVWGHINMQPAYLEWFLKCALLRYDLWGRQWE